MQRGAHTKVDDDHMEVRNGLIVCPYLGDAAAAGIAGLEVANLGS